MNEGLILYAVLALSLLLSLVAIGLSVRSPRREIRTLGREISSLEGELGDLGDRFSRFQRKEGMRSAREAKGSGNINEELSRLAGGGPGGGNTTVPGPGVSTFPARAK